MSDPYDDELNSVPLTAKVAWNIGVWRWCWGTADFLLKQSKIMDFFRIEKGAEGGAVRPAKCGLSQDAKRRRRRSLVMHKKKRRLLPFVPTEDRVRRLEQMASAATALTTSKMEFSNELTYVPSMAPISANQAKLEEGGMQVLSKEDKETIELCRSMLKRGECPPLLVVFDSHEGENNGCDSTMTLLSPADPSQKLVICPDKRGNIARFINGINNHTPENDGCDSMMTLLSPADPSQKLVIRPDKRGNITRFTSKPHCKESLPILMNVNVLGITYATLVLSNSCSDGNNKQNIKCVRNDMDGECHVLLVTCRDIYRGEKLYYDYNGHDYMYQRIISSTRPIVLPCPASRSLGD
uniref:SET domain-containing protein n=1 Tax=Aegilops tauschii TaxID=37682 RepID=M8D415_AEGTA